MAQSVDLQQLLAYTQTRAGQLLADVWTRDVAINALEEQLAAKSVEIGELRRQMEVIQQELVNIGGEPPQEEELTD